MRKNKIAIVISGGGMRCAYGGGALVALAERYNIVEPDLLIAASGSASSAAYYVAGQYEKIAFTWMSLSNDPKFISLFKKPIVNVDYLVDEVLKKRYPYDLKQMKRRKTKFLMPVVRVRDGKLMYLKASADKQIYEAIRATLAAPFIYGKGVKIRGHYYMDGAYGPSAHDYCQRAVQEGASTIILIMNSTQGYSTVVKAFMKAVSVEGELLGQNKGVVRATKKLMKNGYVFIPPKGVNLITIEPQRKISISYLGGTPAAYRQAFNIGYDDVVQNPELDEYFSVARSA